MRETEIAFYAHHQGQGHLQRARAIASRLSHRATIFSSLVADHRSNGVEYRHLEPDYDERCAVESFDHLHYAPLGVDGLRQRAKRLTAWFAEHWPCILVVDVSVEIATLARLCGVPVVYVRQRGERFDTAHNFAYASASRLLAPYPADWEEPDTPSSWREKTDYAGLISRYEHLVKDSPAPHTHVEDSRRQVTIITGFGGAPLAANALVEAARVCPQWDFAIIGRLDHIPSTHPSNASFVGLVDDPLPFIARSDVIVGSAGDSLVSEVAHLQKRFICVPEDRPFGEQRSTAATLARHELATVLHAPPDATHWPVLLQRALMQDPNRWKRWRAAGSHEAARAISRVAQQFQLGTR
jgi:UDP-N-acetylglucosamine:LPS N-acetylglucosamine transferase